MVLGTGALLVALSYPVPMQLLAHGAPSPALWPGADALFTHIIAQGRNFYLKPLEMRGR